MEDILKLVEQAHYWSLRTHWTRQQYKNTNHSTE